jgi:hypothetical protein
MVEKATGKINIEDIESRYGIYSNEGAGPF